MYWSCQRFFKQTSLCLFTALSNMRTLNRQMRFSLQSLKCSAAPPSFRLCCQNFTRRFDLVTARSAVVRSWEEPPNIWLTVARNVFVGWDLNFRVRLKLKMAANLSRRIRSPHLSWWLVSPVLDPLSCQATPRREGSGIICLRMLVG